MVETKYIQVKTCSDCIFLMNKYDERFCFLGRFYLRHLEKLNNVPDDCPLSNVSYSIELEKNKRDFMKEFLAVIEQQDKEGYDEWKLSH